MAHHLSQEALSQLSRFVAERLALNFPRERWRDLERGVTAAANQLGFNDPKDFVPRLLQSAFTRHQIEMLASQLTVGETYFFRDKALFQNLEERVLPDLIERQRGKEQRLRIWSAGCCTGEEPYSVAILLRRLIPNLENWNILILATDINPRFLNTASTGVYKEWSFRETPSWIKSRYFEKAGWHRYRLEEPIQQMVTFAYLNLADDVYPSLLNNTNAMDIILCRNVLMYFSPEQASKAVAKFSASLVEDGWFIVSPSETSLVDLPQLKRTSLPGSTLFRKTKRISLPSASVFSPRVMEVKRSTPGSEFQPSRAEAVQAKPEREEITGSFAEALNLYETGCYADAADRLEVLVSREPRNPDFAALLARVFANQGDLSDALHWCDRALAENKLSPVLHHLRATILQEQGDLKASIASLRRAIYLDPDFVLPHFALGNIALQLTNPAEADKHFGNALRLLEKLPAEAILIGADGITAARLREVIMAAREQEEIA